MTLICWSLKNELISTAQRDRLAVSHDRLPELLSQLRQVWMEELVLISTCQRFEVYLVAPDAEQALAYLNAWARTRADVTPSQSYNGDHAARHLFEVAAGLDSLTLGETEIAGQLRRAWESARTLQCSGKILNGLFAHALATGRQIRHETGIARGAQSLESLAIEKLAQHLGTSVKDTRWLVVGHGQLGQAVLRQLRHRHAQQVRVINRSPQAESRCVLEPWHNLASALSWAEGILVCTAAPVPVVTAQLLGSREKPAAIADLAMPANVSLEPETQPAVALWQLQSLHHHLEQQQQHRCQRLDKAQEELKNCWQNYHDWRQERELAPFLAEIYALTHQSALAREEVRLLRQRLHPLVRALKQSREPHLSQMYRSRLRDLLTLAQA